MRAIVQRCKRARVEVEGKISGEIEYGLTVFLGIMAGDSETQAARLAKKIASLRIFENSVGKMSDSVRDISGQILLISNFTVCGDTRKGNRPSFTAAAPPEKAKVLCDMVATFLEKEESVPVETGVFGADMKVMVENDGPVSLILEV